MRFLLLGSLVCGGAFLFPPASSGNQQPSSRLTAEDNVNSRYTVESVEVDGAAEPTLPPSLQEKIASLIGSRFDPAQFDDLAREIRKQLHLRSVKPHVVRGSAPDRVRVFLETERRSVAFDISVPKFLYHSSQGWSTQLQASTTIAQEHVFRFGIVSDGDELSERYAGFDAGYENLHTGSDRIHSGLLIQEFHEQWNQATLNAAGPAEEGIYRKRRNIQPYVVFVVARPLSVSVGASFQEMQMQGPGAGYQSANAVFADLQYHRLIEGTGSLQREFDAGYDLRLGLGGLDSDYRYSRSRGTLRYAWTLGRNSLTDELLVGYISGNAPMFERFVLGTSSLLRGWNRYVIDPLGGNRVGHNSVQYGFRTKPGTIQVFYDAGALWNQGESATVRHSIGIGYRKSVFSLALAFPLRDGRIEPVFMVGMNY